MFRVIDHLRDPTQNASHFVLCYGAILLTPLCYHYEREGVVSLLS